MSQFPSEVAQKKANEILNLLRDMTVYDIDDTIDVIQHNLRLFSSKQSFTPTNTDLSIIYD